MNEQSSEYVEEQAQDLAKGVLTVRDKSLSWREAGYKTALEAARVLVGSPGYGQKDIHERAAQIVAEEIESDGE